MSNSIEASIHLPQLEFASQKRPERRANQRVQQKFSSNGPWRPSRRDLLLAAGLAGLTATGIFVKSQNDHQSPTQNPTPYPEQTLILSDIYAGWERYANRQLPENIVLAIAKDLSLDTKYPGFSEVGTIILESRQNPNKIKAILPPFTGTIPVALENSVQTAGATATLTFTPAANYIEAQVKDKNTETVEKKTFLDFVSIGLSVELDNSIYLAPKEVKQLLMVKEFSHLLYINPQEAHIGKQVEEKFEITQSTSMYMESFLFLNGQARPDVPQIPSLGDAFDNARIDNDGAGYYHIMRAYGKMKATGILRPVDISVLSSDDIAFETARKRGLLIEKSKGDFSWKEGIGPFSPAWTVITRAILQGKQP